MSHLTEVKTKVSLKNKEWLKGACELLKTQFKGLTYEERGSTIQVRYKPIEVYQQSGNLRFTLQADGTFKMQSDVYRCQKEVEELQNAFLVAYQQYGVNAYMMMDGFQMTQGKDQTGKVMVVATRY